MIEGACHNAEPVDFWHRGNRWTFFGRGRWTVNGEPINGIYVPSDVLVACATQIPVDLNRKELTSA